MLEKLTKEKKVEVFNDNFIKPGDFMTYCFLIDGETTNGQHALVEGTPLNGIVTGVYEDCIRFTDKRGVTNTIELEELLGSTPDKRILAIGDQIKA